MNEDPKQQEALAARQFSVFFPQPLDLGYTGSALTENVIDRIADLLFARERKGRVAGLREAMTSLATYSNGHFHPDDPRAQVLKYFAVEFAQRADAVEAEGKESE